MPSPYLKIGRTPRTSCTTAADSGLGDEEHLLLRACMEQLGGEERRIFLLHAVAGFKHREIAEFMELPLATVLSKYSRAVKKMRKYLEEAELYD